MGSDSGPVGPPLPCDQSSDLPSSRLSSRIKRDGATPYEDPGPPEYLSPNFFPLLGLLLRSLGDGIRRVTQDVLLGGHGKGRQVVGCAGHISLTLCGTPWVSTDSGS